MAVHASITCAAHFRPELRLWEQALQLRAIEHLRTACLPWQLLVPARELLGPLFPLRLTDAEVNAAIRPVVDFDAAVRRQFLREGGPQCGAPTRKLLIGRLTEALSLHPYETEIRFGRAQVAICAVEHEHPPTLPGEAVSNGGSDYARAHHDGIAGLRIAFIFWITNWFHERTR